MLVLISTSELASQRPGTTVLCFFDKVWLGLQKSCKQTAVLLISADPHVRVGPTTSRHHGAFTRGIRALCVKNAEHCGYRCKEAEGPEQAPGHHASTCKIKMAAPPH
ncbi:uncharacterized protein LOC142591602 [Dermacentor variabilis]|uniref:uncharacterized protein LOC142591602 n=1 Tax=Dermacentor variabilis TaxID=34621 RepID=UPI003F5BCEE0